MFCYLFYSRQSDRREISTPSFSVNESGTPIAAVTVTRTGRSSGVIGVTITPTNGTATATGDYNKTPINISFADGEIAKTVVIPIIDDGLIEGNETVNLTLGTLTGGATLGTQNTAVLTIVDNDNSNGLQITGTEGSDTLTGQAGNDTLIERAGNDNLDGRAGNDTLLGGIGNDVYFVDSSGDNISENASEGIDTIYSSVS